MTATIFYAYIVKRGFDGVTGIFSRYLHKILRESLPLTDLMLASEHTVKEIEQKAKKVMGMLKRGVKFAPTQPNAIAISEKLKRSKRMFLGGVNYMVVTECFYDIIRSPLSIFAVSHAFDIIV